MGLLGQALWGGGEGSPPAPYSGITTMTRQKLQTQSLLTTDYLPRWDQKVVSAAVVCYEEQQLQRPYQQQQQCGDRVGRQPTIPLPWAVLLRFQLVGDTGFSRDSPHVPQGAVSPLMGNDSSATL